jgi:hypothetical protein
MIRFFESFLNNMKASFQRIAGATRGEMSVEELQSDAWIAASEIGEKRGREIDFTDPGDQNLLLGALHIRNVRRPEKNMRYAARIDQTWEGDEGEMNAWVNRLSADDAADPLISLIQQESRLDEDGMLIASYSQAAAYVMVFAHFKNSCEDVCAYLAISKRTLSQRIQQSANTVRVQRSLFDRIVRIPVDFMPSRGYVYPARLKDERGVQQWGWTF